ncbi:Vomeronasal type-2 receptor 26 [Heterocephalus glaber]|uniref:Vomeronasal type-2 receptor 26 n=1 Tax=Heterocephalus glaber TaxID=10181 RepID=G5BAS4_HETGA|nr:Vomeronasal type-2 receptor 26 [Heterocephalus glaber]
MGKIAAGIALSLTVLRATVIGLFVKHQDTPIIKANNKALSYTLLNSLIFCFLCSLLFIGCSNTATCILQQITFGVVFTVTISTALGKTITMVLAFKMRRNPPYIDTDAHSEHGHIIIVCNKGSCVLGYLGSLAQVSFTVAFLERNLPDTFNEAKFLTCSILVVCSVWVTFLPVHRSTKGKVMVAMEVLFILASSEGLLDCSSGPKCYILLLRPDRNSLHGFRDKTHCHRKKLFYV